MFFVRKQVVKFGRTIGTDGVTPSLSQPRIKFDSYKLFILNCIFIEVICQFKYGGKKGETDVTSYFSRKVGQVLLYNWHLTIKHSCSKSKIALKKQLCKQKTVLLEE